MSSYINNQKGIAIVSVIILIAFLYAGLTAYSYYNPNFTLSQYTPIAFLNRFNDEKRVEDLEKISVALDEYYDENRNLPGRAGFCGRLFSMINSEAKTAISPYFPDGIPQDPAEAGTNKDYFYSREDRDTYVLMAVLDYPSTDETYDYEGCHDWPGDGIYNYRLTND